MMNTLQSRGISMRRYAHGVTFLSFTLIVGCSGDADTFGDGDFSALSASNPTRTVSYPLNDFTGVSISQPFVASIAPGPFSIEVTVDVGVADLLDVGKRGQILDIGFVTEIPSQNERHISVQTNTAIVEIAMPTLASISLVGESSAAISDFNGSFLEVQLTNTATLEGQNVGYDLLMADVDRAGVL